MKTIQSVGFPFLFISLASVSPGQMTNQFLTSTGVALAFDSFHSWGASALEKSEGPAYGIYITGYDEITFQMGNFRDPSLY